ncbi:hypothetical protein AMTR_s00065p00049290, partial [Amborella trichopoda]
ECYVFKDYIEQQFIKRDFRINEAPQESQELIVNTILVRAKTSRFVFAANYCSGARSIRCITKVRVQRTVIAIQLLDEEVQAAEPMELSSESGYDIVAHLKKILAMLSIYDLLKILPNM